MTETVKETETRIGRRLSKSELAYKKVLDSECACGHNGHSHAAPLLGGPVGHPCWAIDCKCYSFPEGWTFGEKQKHRMIAKED